MIPPLIKCESKANRLTRPAIKSPEGGYWVGVSYLFVFAHEISISCRGPRPTYKIVQFHFANTNRYDTACSKCITFEGQFLQNWQCHQ